MSVRWRYWSFKIAAGDHARIDVSGLTDVLSRFDRTVLNSE
jgi:hypothetical protein